MVMWAPLSFSHPTKLVNWLLILLLLLLLLLHSFDGAMVTKKCGSEQDCQPNCMCFSQMVTSHHYTHGSISQLYTLGLGQIDKLIP